MFTGDTTLIAITITNQGPGSLYVAPGTCNSDFRLVGATSGAVYYPGEPELCTQSAVAPFNLAVGGNYSYTVWTTGRVRSGSATAAVATIAPGTYTVQTYLMSTVGGDAIARQSTSTGTTITFR